MSKKKEEKIRLEIVTPEREVLSLQVEWFYLPTLLGPTGILHDHAPMLAAITAGVLRYKSGGQEYRLAVGRGFLEVKDNVAEILVQSAEPAAQIDVARAQAALRRGRQRLLEADEALDLRRVEAAIERARARLAAAQVAEEEEEAADLD